MGKKIRIYKVDFEPVYPVPHGLIIASTTEEEAKEIASNQLGTNEFTIEEIKIKGPTVIFYESGDY